MELLELMDIEDPVVNLTYMDIHDEFRNYGINDVIDVHALSIRHLATFGSMGPDLASRLHQYAHERLLKPLGLLKGRRADGHGSIEVLEVERSAAEEAVVEDVAVEGAVEGGKDVVEVTAEGDGWASSVARLTTPTPSASDLS
jgi:hypothetical protein